MNAVAVRLLILASLFFGQASAFTTSPLSQLGSITKNKHCRSTAKKGFVLGPVSRNGIEFEDETYGEGRRILPGDTVYCYYTGSFVADAKPKNDGPFAGLLGGGGSSAPKVTVFDQVSKFGFALLLALSNPCRFVAARYTYIR